MEFKFTDALIPFSNTSNQQSGPEENSLENESEVVDALIAFSVSKKSLKDDMEAKSDTERDSENVKITQVSRNVNICSSSVRSHKDSASLLSKAEAILTALTLAKFSGGCYCEAKIRQVLGDTPDTSKALRRLVADGKVKKEGEGGRLQPYVYSLP